jgi:glycosyltransferase involved in cell wall biosynthesis
MDRIIIIHPLDPRGSKIGGIETHVREHMASTAADAEVILIGIDEIGDLTLGKVNEVDYAGKKAKLFPILKRTGTDHHHAAKNLLSSLTFNFFFAFLKHYPAIRSLVLPGRTSVEIQRMEYSTFGRLLGAPSVQIIHGEGRPDQPMDSILKRYWAIQQINEAITVRAASHIIGVNENVVRTLKQRFPSIEGAIDMMTVSVNTDTFRLGGDLPPMDKFRVCFAGRLDAFKNPNILFGAVAHLNNVLGVPTEFIYIGGGDPEKFPAYSAIKSNFKRLGALPSAGVAAAMADAHVGVLASEFEGFPCFVLELLSVGRPLVALELPQYGLVVEDGVSGFMVKRGTDEASNIVALARGLAHARDQIAKGALKPADIRARIKPYSNAVQMKRLYEAHARLRWGERRLTRVRLNTPSPA